MKRELKVAGAAGEYELVFGFRRCPYEEGTESLRIDNRPIERNEVSDAVPMKRELKGPPRLSPSWNNPGFRRCPYEEGTESSHAFAIAVVLFQFQTLSL